MNNTYLRPNLENTIMARTKTSKSDANVVQESVDMLNESEVISENRSIALLSSVKSGAQAAQQAAAQVGPAVGNGLRAAAYKGIYSLAYGFTFGVLLAGKMMPAGGFVADAVNDGNTAAKLAFDEREARIKTQAEESAAALSA